jgi:integrase
MSINYQKKVNTFSISAISYLPAILREHKSGWLIEYYVEHPVTHRFIRKTMKMNHVTKRFKSKLEARRHINKIINNLNIRLSTGWNPLFTDENIRLYTSVEDVCNSFLIEKKKDTRVDTIRSYSSFVSIFSTWLNGKGNIGYFSLINRVTISQFMDYVYMERNVSPRSYNNYVKIGRALFNWAKAKCYTNNNPFDFIQLKKKEKKKRILVPSESRQQIIRYLHEKMPNYMILLKLEYNALIRPNEIRNLKVFNTDLINGTITVESSVAKNHNERIITMTPDLVADFEKMNLSQYNKQFYLFSHNFVPGKERVGPRYYSDFWVKMRNDLNLPTEMQLYSLRDTGIFEMLKSGIDSLSVKQHADHHSLEMTSIYSDHVDPNLAKIIREKSPTF